MATWLDWISCQPIRDCLSPDIVSHKSINTDDGFEAKIMNVTIFIAYWP